MNANQKNEISDALRENTILILKDRSEMQLVKTVAWDAVDDFLRLEKIAQGIINSDVYLFQVAQQNNSSQYFVRCSTYGELFLKALKLDALRIKETFSMHQFNPYVQLIIDKIIFLQVNMFVGPFYDLSYGDCKSFVDLLNQQTEIIRREGNGPKFNSQLNNFLRSSNKNYGELKNYLGAIFDVFSRVLVIRLDLGYLKVETNSIKNGSNDLNYPEVKQHWKNLLFYLRNKLPKNYLIGFVWKLEYGREKTFHFHVMIILDGSKAREDVTIAKLIGEHWSRVVTNNKGLYYNCNASKIKYKDCGIGMISHDDVSKRDALNKAALYLTKVDQLIKLHLPSNGRTFGKGNVPKPKKGNNGRPRNGFASI